MIEGVIGQRHEWLNPRGETTDFPVESGEMFLLIPKRPFVGPLNMSCKAKHFLQHSGFVPCSKNQWQGRFPAATDSRTVWQYFPKAVPLLRHWTHARVIAAVSDQCFH